MKKVLPISKAIPNRIRKRIGLLLFPITFVCMHLVAPYVPERDTFYRDTPDLDRTWYATASDGHEELYWNYGGFVANARQAEILILGHSRTMFAFTHELTSSLANRVGKRIFNLGFSYYEACTFPLAVMDRNQLHPDLVIVNVDGFFRPDASSAALSLLDATDFPDGEACGEAITYDQIERSKWPQIRDGIESTFASSTKKWLHSRVPRWSTILPSEPASFGCLRSIIDGSWALEALPHDSDGEVFVPWDRSPLAETETLASARAFQRRMQARGIAIVLTLVPHPSASRAQAKLLAEALDVPLIAPEIQGLSTLDGSHLDLRSAELFMEAFIEEFASLLKVEGLQGSD